MKTAEALQRAVDYIEEHLLDELPLHDAAAQAYLSDAHFQRLFSVVFGISLGEYIRGRRLTLAGKALVGAGGKVIDIALQYGYESPESFSRAFARFHGFPPSAARSRKGQLHVLEKLSVQSVLGGNEMDQNWKERGYTVYENAPVYYTQDMDKTLAWFEQVLGWRGNIDARDGDGRGIYGCVMSLPMELHTLTQIPFNGFHLFSGEPSIRTVGFIRVSGDIEKLAASVKGSGWQQISAVTAQPWGARACDVTTVDGSILRFFQID